MSTFRVSDYVKFFKFKEVFPGKLFYYHLIVVHILNIHISQNIFENDVLMGRRFGFISVTTCKHKICAFFYL